MCNTEKRQSQPQKQKHIFCISHKLFSFLNKFLRFLTTINFLAYLTQYIKQYFIAQLDDRKMIEKLKAEKFDFGITEFYGQCAYVIYKEIELKNYATTFATEITENYFGVSSMPSYVPGKLNQLM